MWVLILTAHWLPGPVEAERFSTRQECEARIEQEKRDVGWLAPDLRDIVFTCVEVR